MRDEPIQDVPWKMITAHWKFKEITACMQIDNRKIKPKAIWELFKFISYTSKNRGS